MSYLVHEHCNATSAIDKYWIFTDKTIANKFFIKLLTSSKYYLDVEYYNELSENLLDKESVFESLCENQGKDEYICLRDNDYLIFATINSDNFARRP